MGRSLSGEGDAPVTAQDAGTRDETFEHGEDFLPRGSHHHGGGARIMWRRSSPTGQSDGGV